MSLIPQLFPECEPVPRLGILTVNPRVPTMTTREALIAAIAAAPDDDLPRLVAADWFEENGEPERAEFVRLQLLAFAGLGMKPPPRSSRSVELVSRHAARWFAPFLDALDPTRPGGVGCWFDGRSSRNCLLHGPKGTPDQPGYFRSAACRRGFVCMFDLHLEGRPPASSVGAALRAKPATALHVVVHPHRRAWGQFTEPELARITDLSVHELTHGWPLMAILPAFEDPHLSGVRTLTLYARNPTTRPHLMPLDANTVRAFVASPLARRVTDLTSYLDESGLRVLCEADGPRFESLRVRNRIDLSTEVALSLASAGFAGHLRRLEFSAAVDDTALRALTASGRLPRLTELQIHLRDTSGEGLAALAAAEFTPGLEEVVLDFEGELPDTAALRPLAQALRPDVLQQLRVVGLGVDVPDFFACRFGGRVEFE